MPVEIKNSLQGGMNVDDSYHVLPKTCYSDALNITRDAIEGGNDGISTNIISNRIVAFNLPAGTNKVIGAFPFPLRGTVIEFLYNSNGYNSIIEFNVSSRTRTLIFQSLVDSATDILNFTSTGKITSVNVFSQDEGDLLFFLDTLGRPTTLNITRFKNDEYNPVTRDLIDTAKTPIAEPPYAVYDNDTSRRVNNLRNKFFRFAQVNVFDDNEESTFSPQSAMPIPDSLLSETFTNVITNNNVITLSLNSGPKNVKAIRLLMSYVNKTNNWSDFATVEVINKSSIALTETTTPWTLGTTTRLVTVFKGYVAVGTVVNIYLTLLPSTQTLVGTYTTVPGDTITSIYNGLAASITSIGIGTLPSVGGWGLYFDFNNTLYSFDEIEITVLNTDVDNISFPYSFYNDSTYPTYDVPRAIQLFDYVPTYAESQEMANGNTLEFAGLSEGLSRTLIPNVVNTISTIAAGNGVPVGSLNGVLNMGVTPATIGTQQIAFSGVPATGTVITIKLKRISDGVYVTAGTYTTIAGDTFTSVIAALDASMTALGIVIAASAPPPNFLLYDFYAEASGVTPRYYSNDTLFTVVAPVSSASGNSLATWLWSTERNIGIAYFDLKGKTNGILYNARVKFPAYAENGSFVPLVPYINTKIFHVPPIWAHSYNFYFTKEPTIPLFWHIIDVNTTETDYLYFDVTNIVLNQTKNPTTANVLSYEFVDGDRMRLIRRMSDNTVYSDTYDAQIYGLVKDPKINNVTVTGSFIKIKKIAPFDTVDYTSKYFVIEIYRPGQQAVSGDNETYFEFGGEYPILNPETSSRVHGGEVTDQSTNLVTPAEFNFYDGDTYVRPRVVPITETGTATFFVQDRNAVDFYISAVNSISGRPSLIDVYAKETVFPAVIRFSQEVQPNTNINGLNRFFPNNFIECDASFGSIQRMQVRDRQLEIFQYFKTGFSPIFSQLGKAADGSTILLTTDKLLNPVQYYQGDWGIGEAKASLAYFGYAIYFHDTTKGAILRLSRDGLTPISILYKVNSWATKEIVLRIADNIIGAFDQKAENYIFALEAVTGSAATTRAFSERSNSFESRLSYIPEMMCTIGTLLVSYKNGQTYTHDGETYNEFYGVKYPSSITLVWNENPIIKKKYLAVGYQSKNNVVWASPENGDILTSTVNNQTGLPQISQLKDVDYELEEVVLNAAFLRDANSMNDARLAVLEGDFLGGSYMVQKFICPATSAGSLVNFVMPYINYILSPRNL